MNRPRKGLEGHNPTALRAQHRTDMNAIASTLLNVLDKAVGNPGTVDGPPLQTAREYHLEELRKIAAAKRQPPKPKATVDTRTIKEIPAAPPVYPHLDLATVARALAPAWNPEALKALRPLMAAAAKIEKQLEALTYQATKAEALAAGSDRAAAQNDRHAKRLRLRTELDAIHAQACPHVDALTLQLAAAIEAKAASISADDAQTAAAFGWPHTPSPLVLKMTATVKGLRLRANQSNRVLKSPAARLAWLDLAAVK